MKKKNTFSPARSKLTVLHQICNLIPAHLVRRLAPELGVDKQARDFTPWSHVVSMLYTHVAHALSLNDVCDSLEMHSLSPIRGAAKPSRNGLSHANKHRPAALAEQLFWHLLDHLQHLSPGFALVQSGAEHEVRRAREACAGLRAGEIAIFDKGYIDFVHLHDLSMRGVLWVTRAKETLGYEVVERRPPAHDKILCDEIIELKYSNSHRDYPLRLRRVVAMAPTGRLPGLQR